MSSRGSRQMRSGQLRVFFSLRLHVYSVWISFPGIYVASSVLEIFQVIAYSVTKTVLDG
ncbi:hypothetical protein K470DRAFT_259264 [Piedraia hortae CBS 480.64]|uniref:Uncharacterized protein n=1 Tax=Piedraia hortae CBS 480.64 TaxID=1314780 RepID=A0A6A7BUG2_9PEZI|nr:hypothetical protein K470DRAFT_259264 [Piedraia hortae CBS 480.64]